METIELAWIRPTLRTAIRLSIEIDDLHKASRLFDMVQQHLVSLSTGPTLDSRGTSKRRLRNWSRIDASEHAAPRGGTR